MRSAHATSTSWPDAPSPGPSSWPWAAWCRTWPWPWPIPACATAPRREGGVCRHHEGTRVLPLRSLDRRRRRGAVDRPPRADRALSGVPLRASDAAARHRRRGAVAPAVCPSPATGQPAGAALRGGSDAPASPRFPLARQAGAPPGRAVRPLAAARRGQLRPRRVRPPALRRPHVARRGALRGARRAPHRHGGRRAVRVRGRRRRRGADAALGVDPRAAVDLPPAGAENPDAVGAPGVDLVPDDERDPRAGGVAIRCQGSADHRRRRARARLRERGRVAGRESPTPAVPPPPAGLIRVRCHPSNPVVAGVHPRRGHAVVCRRRVPGPDAELGRNAARGGQRHGDRGFPLGAEPGCCDLHRGTRPQPAGAGDRQGSGVGPVLRVGPRREIGSRGPAAGAGGIRVSGATTRARRRPAGLTSREPPRYARFLPRVRRRWAVPAHRRHAPSLVLSAALAVLLLAPFPSGQTRQPPDTKREVVVERLHGVEVADPYRWLEDQSSPATRAWIDAQNAYTQTVLGPLPGTDRIRARLAALMKVDTVSLPTVRGSRYFFSRRAASQELPVLYVRKGSRGRDEVLIDPHPMSRDHTVSVVLQDVSRDGRLVAYGVRSGGEDEVVVRLIDVDTRKDLADQLPRARYSGVSISPDGSAVYYSRQTREGPRVFFHSIGTDPA